MGAMTEPVIVQFTLDTVPGLNRHRVSVWNADGGQLSPPSAEGPAELAVRDGETIFVEASVPAEPKKNKAPSRDEGRWRLRVSADATDVLKLGKTRTKTSAIEIRVHGAEQSRAPRPSSS
jgi:hypothetical protein